MRKNKIITLSSFLILGIFAAFVLCNLPARAKWLSIKIQNRIAYIQHNYEFQPNRVLQHLKDIAWDVLTLETENSDPLIQSSTFSPVNNMSLVYIPAGDFFMGSSEFDKDHYEDEEPLHDVYLGSYWISKTQITNAQYASCVEEGACVYSVSFERNPRYVDTLYSNHPVVYISWYQAQNYCIWSGGRLPSEAEWEKAARGPYGPKYAWGSENPSINLYLTNANNIIGDTTPVGLFVMGGSYYGAMDMGGNVREWVLDWYDPSYFTYSPDQNPTGPEAGEKKVLKGAGFSDPYDYSRAASRLAHEPTSPGINRGFRCVYTHATSQLVHFSNKN